MSISISSENFSEKFTKFCSVIEESNNNNNNDFLFLQGIVDVDRVQSTLTSDLHIWLLQFEFSETLIHINSKS